MVVREMFNQGDFLFRACIFIMLCMYNCKLIFSEKNNNPHLLLFKQNKVDNIMKNSLYLNHVFFHFANMFPPLDNIPD